MAQPHPQQISNETNILVSESDLGGAGGVRMIGLDSLDLVSGCFFLISEKLRTATGQVPTARPLRERTATGQVPTARPLRTYACGYISTKMTKI